MGRNDARPLFVSPCLITSAFAQGKKELRRTARAGVLAIVLAATVMMCLSSSAALGACPTLAGTVSTWTDGNSNWLNAGNWNSGVPNSTTSACINDGTSTVTLDANQVLNTLDLQIGSGNTLTSGLNMDLFVFGTQIINNGQFLMNGGGGANTFLALQNNVTLSGTGALTLTTAGGGGTSFIEQAFGGLTLTNQSTIQGAGIIGQNGLALVNSGTVNANTSGQVLTLQGTAVTNTGLMEATNSGVLNINGVAVNNAGGTISANGAGAFVQLFGNTTIQGGTLNNNGGAFFGTPQGNVAVLDGSTGAGAVTINGTYTSALNTDTYLLGTINNAGNIQVNGGGGTNTQIFIDSANVMLQGGGTVTLSSLTGGGQAFIDQAAGGLTLINVNNTIQGDGILGQNGLTIINQATINANSNGGAEINALTIQGTAVTNTGLMEATNSGVLNINGVVVNNAGGNIASTGAGASVQLFGSAVIQGGTLTNNGGAFFGTPAGNVAVLDGSTGAGPITINGTYTSDLGSNTYLLGTITNKNNFQVNGGNGTNTQIFIDSANVMLQGGGTLTLSSLTGGGQAFIDQAAGGLTLTNVDNTIQGAGIIGNNGLTLVNQTGGIINANSTGGPQITTLTVQGASVTNTGLMEATNSGVLNINGVVVNNAGGNITANGAGASVQLYGSTVIQGGTLTNNGGAFFGTPAGNVAVLDGSTGAGPITINGTYTSDLGSDTYLLGTINNKNNFQVNGGNGTNSVLLIDSNNVMLKGGGTLTLSTAGGGGNAYIEQAAGGLTLTNVDNTIQGAGIIGNNGLSVLNDAAGTILANAFGQNLYVNGGGTVTNNGTYQANAGSALVLQNVAFTNFSGNTLTGGTYNVYGTLASPGTLQINALGGTGGEIVNNAATILLNGPNSNFVDAAGLDTLSNFSNNTGAGRFTIQAGRNITSPGDFANAGAVNVGAGSTFTTGGTGNYNQSGGNTKVDGALVAGGGQVNINGGTLSGNGGSITGNVTMGGTLSPGDNVATAGMLTINGNYTQTLAGIFQLDIGGLTAGTQFDFLKVNGQAFLDGTLDISLINGFVPLVGDTFTFLVTDPGVFDVFATVNGLDIGNGEFFAVIYNPDSVELMVNGQRPVPEPGTFLLLGSGLLSLLYGVRWRQMR